MPRINQQVKTFFSPLRCIAAAGMSIAFATSAFAQVTQLRQAEPNRSEVTPREGTNEKVDTKACVDADIEQYVSNLGTPKLTDAEFESLVRCGTQAVPALSQLSRMIALTYAPVQLIFWDELAKTQQQQFQN